MGLLPSSPSQRRPYWSGMSPQPQHGSGLTGMTPSVSSGSARCAATVHRCCQLSPGRRCRRTARRAAACPAWPWHVQRSLGFLAVPPAGRSDQGSVGQGELVQVGCGPSVRTRRRSPCRAARTSRCGRRSGPGPAWATGPGVHAVHQLHPDRKMSTSHLCLRRKLAGRLAPVFAHGVGCRWRLGDPGRL
jgi:hypothetical protein